MRTGRLIVGITGASGAPYAVRFLELAREHFEVIYLALSEQARQVIAVELQRSVTRDTSLEQLLGFQCDNITLCDQRNYFTPPASGSFRHDGMVIVPCSMGTAGRIASGISNDLITRAADVCLKERRKLILVPRETPWNLIHLRNMAALTEAGATILPASPGFYNNPATIADLVDHVVARIFDQLGIATPLVPEWQNRED